MQASFSGRTLQSTVPDSHHRVASHAVLPVCSGLQFRNRASRPFSTQPTLSSVSNLSTQGSKIGSRLSSCIVRALGDDEEDTRKVKAEFGYSRKDVIIIGAGLIGVGYALYYGAQSFGVEAAIAGNFVQLFIFLVICVGYISTYIFRVANKDMTYAKQLDAYEERVMQKRLEEMPETERERLMEEVAIEQKRKAEKGR